VGDVKQGNFGAARPATLEPKGDQGAVIDLGAFRTRKNLTADRKSSVSESFRGMTSPRPEMAEMELAERIERIKGSIQRINHLMQELRGTSEGAPTPAK
jgi:hypothetical protein